MQTILLKKNSINPFRTLFKKPLITIFILVIVFFCLCFKTEARQSLSNSKDYYVETIVLLGNKVTKNKIILRELSFKQGSSIPKADFDVFLELEKNKIFNTNLFTTVKISHQQLTGNSIAIFVTVLEKWYTWPVPLFELTDDFNIWWNVRNRDLSRVEYGINFKQRNFRGMNELLKVRLQTGFTSKVELLYDIPYIDKKQRTGIKFKLLYAENKTADYAYLDSKPLTISKEKKLRTRIRTSVTLSKRIRYYSTNTISLKYQQEQVVDSIAILNPEYIGNDATEIKMFEFSYVFSRLFLDKKVYPLKGNTTKIRITKKGLGLFDEINNLDIAASYTRYIDLGHKLYFATGLSTKLSFPENQGYFTQTGFGVKGILLRGYDLYTIPGIKVAAFKNTMRWQIFSRELQSKKVLKKEQFSVVPVDIFFKSILDIGYADNPRVLLENARLSNKTLMAIGVGLDIVTFYNSVLRLNYTYNGEKEKNFNIHFKVDI